jgi:ankyrin repeat protein
VLKRWGIRLTLFLVILLGAIPARGFCTEKLTDAVKKDDIVQTQTLLAAGANVNRRDDRGKTPLLLAAENGDIAMAQLLLGWKADVNAADDWNKTPLLAAAQRRNTPLIELLLGAKADPDIANRNGITPLIASVQKDNRAGVSMLLDKGAAVNAQDSMGRTALLWAVYRQHANIARLLLEHHAAVSITDNDHKSALLVAEEEQADPQLIQRLKSRLGQDGSQENRSRTAPVVGYHEVRKIFHPVIVAGRLQIGNPKAPVTIVEYTDLECPYCAAGARLMKAVLEHYGDKVRIVVKNDPLPLHRQALMAALYLEAVLKQDPNKALAFMDLVFARQTELKNGQTFLDAAARAVGADMGQLRRDVDSTEIRKIVESDLAEEERFRLDGVPVFIINGTAWYGVPTEAHLFGFIDDQLAHKT